MDEKLYSTGEIARLCGITKRTVQFYDKEKQVKLPPVFKMMLNDF